ncbi:MAG: hypothetical protein C5B59_06435 [Bacteroidetes bacterium]|nr:MAG: hypothetical protein C5B59_06435 [Bacteroidota bacterium]
MLNPKHRFEYEHLIEPDPDSTSSGFFIFFNRPGVDFFMDWRSKPIMVISQNSPIMKLLLALPLMVLLIVLIYFVDAEFWSHKGPRYQSRYRLTTNEKAKIVEHAVIIRNFLHGKDFNNNYCFLIDMSIPSGKKRFFVYDLRKDTVLGSGLVAHGHCNHGFSFKPAFSNRPGSCCTALGKYSVGFHYQGTFGSAYKLSGLDSSNRNAFERNIVLHSYGCVPESETYPIPICNSSGCPMVSQVFLKHLQPIIDHAGKPIILWIY